MPTWKLTKKTLSQILLHVFCLHFLRTHASRLLLPKRLLKVCEQNFFQKKRAKSSVACNVPVELRFIYVNFLHVEYGVWLCLQYGFCHANWNLLQCITKITKKVFWYVVFLDKKLIVLHDGDILFYSVLTSVSNTHFQQ